jgi:hypothetical protein
MPTAPPMSAATNVRTSQPIVSTPTHHRARDAGLWRARQPRPGKQTPSTSIAVGKLERAEPM